MQLKYIGPRPDISFGCVSFHKAKEDKFVYISPAFQLLLALQHDYNSCEHFADPLEPLCMGKDLLEKISEFADADLNTCIKKHQEQLLCLFDRELQWVRENRYMDPLSKKSYVDNHTLMREYRLQRQINKSVYYLLIDRLAQAVRQKRIAYIITPLHERFTYILINLQKNLMRQKIALFSELELFQEKEELKLRLRFLSRI